MNEKGRRSRASAECEASSSPGRRPATGAHTPDRVRWAVELLDVRPADHILEIGCGPGHGVSLVCQRIARGTVTAIDRSPVAIARARERNRGCIEAGRARIERAELTNADLGRRFRKVFAINVNAFWTTPADTIPALQRLLDPKGALWLVYEPPSESRLRSLRESLPRELETNGFSVVRVQTQRFQSSFGVAILGRPR